MDTIDLDSAVKAGVLRPDQADALRRFEERERGIPTATEERFNLIVGVADVMAAVALFLVVGSAGVVIQALPLSSIFFPPICWWAATYFTGKLRMLVSSHVLFGGFCLYLFFACAAVGLTLLGFPVDGKPHPVPRWINPLIFLVIAGGCWLYWKRFALPVAVAACACSLITVLIWCAMLTHVGEYGKRADVALLIASPFVFIAAMWWDMSDVRRETPRAQVGFWLHLIAGFLILKTSMGLLLGTNELHQGWARVVTLTSNDPVGAGALATLLLFALFSAVAIVIDRRSLLLSGMVYAVPALASVLGTSRHATLPGLAFGAYLLALAIWWVPIRAAMLRHLPSKLTAQVPRSHIGIWGARPVY